MLDHEVYGFGTIKSAQALYPVVGIGPPPLTRKRVLIPRSFGFKGETHSLAREGVGIGEQTVWISRYMY
jgi:hypothetical protein